MRNLKKRKAEGKDEVTGEMVKGEGDMLRNWTWRLCSMTFKRDLEPEDWRSPVIAPLYKGKGGRTK